VLLDGIHSSRGIAMFLPTSDREPFSYASGCVLRGEANVLRSFVTRWSERSEVLCSKGILCLKVSPWRRTCVPNSLVRKLFKVVPFVENLASQSDCQPTEASLTQIQTDITTETIRDWRTMIAKWNCALIRHADY